MLPPVSLILLFFSAVPAAGQTGGGGLERVQVTFTPTVCKVRCLKGHCINFCQRGNVTTLYSGEGRGAEPGPAFRVVVCPLLCQNGGVCLHQDRCLCPPSFAGKFCQISVSSLAASPASTNEIFKLSILATAATDPELALSEFLLPLGQKREAASPGAPPMVKVMVQHPPEAGVKVHQVLKVPRLSSSPSSGMAGAPAPSGPRVQAQTVRGGGTYTENSRFKYCFKELSDGQCSSPLPGLRSREMCCGGIGKGWGITDCVLCSEATGQSNSSCPSGFERGNGTHCVDVNECLRPGMCDNGLCVNTMGSFSCVCRAGFILDASHGICISQSVISEERGQCYRVLGSGLGPSSCSLPILRNITKQICCCSRVGKAWGRGCLRCPHFGSGAFKEICPAGHGYHYSASALNFNQRLDEQLGGRGATLVTQGNRDHQGSDSGSTSSGSAGPQQRPPVGSNRTQSRPGPTQSQPRPPDTGAGPQSPVRPGSRAGSVRPQAPSSGTQGVRPPYVAQPDPDPALARPQSPEPRRTPSLRPAVPPTARTTRVQTVRGVCERQPGVCGPGRCLDRPGGKHTCVCDLGYQANSQHTHCQDVDECFQTQAACPGGKCVNAIGSFRCVCPSGYSASQQESGCQDVDECRSNPCRDGRCDNTPGSYRCLCRHGYRLTGNTCTDVDECGDPLQCPGQECINTQGSFRCTSCRPGYGLVNRLCTDVDECRRSVACSNGRCENTPGSFRCVCNHGYKLQNDTCTDVDECAEPSQCPAQRCVNSVGSYRCVSCGPGYILTNRHCEDVNECEDSELCPGQRCINTEGSFNCVDCQQGHTSVKGVCTDTDECVQPSKCPGQLCVNTVGSYHCVSCQPGYSRTNGSCQDVDECARVGVCESERVCVNTLGSFRCDCALGYRSSGLSERCRDINECLEGDFCFSGGECVNAPGSYTCVCSQGFILSPNGTSCLDVDECVESGLCLNGHCVNTEGSFQCQCQTGFTSNPERTNCLDVDECVASDPTVCESQRCQNTIGSYRCISSCEPGYQVSQAGQCVDVNECADEKVCGEHTFCQNVLGTYVCVCDQGFTSNSDGKSCIDQDECVSLPGVCGSARCENVEGSFMCECDRGEFDPGSRKCLGADRAVLPPQSSSAFSSPLSWDLLQSPLPDARPGELRECYYNLADRGTCSLLATNTSHQECCCTVGQGWGLGCQYHACPQAHTAEFLSLCPSGRGYVTTGTEAFSYRDVDECKIFHPEVCKNGVCVNNIPGYNCYCSSGYVYNSTLLECVDHDECEEESCVGGVCVNTVGSYYCSCPSPLVLDDTQRNCVNSSHLPVDENTSVCWRHVSADLMCQSPLLGAQFTFTDCCCLYGEGWSMECALCPSTDSDDYAFLCSSIPPPLFQRFPDATGSETVPGAGRVAALPRYPPYAPVRDYDDYSPAGGAGSSFGGRSGGSYRRPDPGFFSEGDYSASPDAPPSFRLPVDPRAETTFGLLPPPPPSRPDAPRLSLAPLPGRSYEEQEEAWRPPFPPFAERRGGGEPRRVYERRYESYAGLSAADDCGILHGCENGRCIRVAEGYTCDCYHGYELDMTSMTCIDLNECEDVGVEFPCVNARCVNTEGSFRCVCRRGYVMSRRPNHCVAA